jgi:hypothetical protein
MRKRTAAMIVMGLVLAFALVPFASPHCPDWTVSVVDQQDQPIPGMTVRLSYQNYSIEDQSHEMDRITDQRGQVTFPAQTIHASLLRRCYYTVLSARAGVHASFGPSAYAFAFDKGMEGSDVDPKPGILAVSWSGTPGQMQSRIVINRRSN